MLNLLQRFPMGQGPYSPALEQIVSEQPLNTAVFMPFDSRIPVLGYMGSYFCLNKNNMISPIQLLLDKAGLQFYLLTLVLVIRLRSCILTASPFRTMSWTSELQTTAVELLLLEPRQQMREMLVMLILLWTFYFLSVYILSMYRPVDFVHLEAGQAVKD